MCVASFENGLGLRVRHIYTYLSAAETTRFFSCLTITSNLQPLSVSTTLSLYHLSLISVLDACNSLSFGFIPPYPRQTSLFFLLRPWTFAPSQPYSSRLALNSSVLFDSIAFFSHPICFALLSANLNLRFIIAQPCSVFFCHNPPIRNTFCSIASSAGTLRIIHLLQLALLPDCSIRWNLDILKTILESGNSYHQHSFYHRFQLVVLALFFIPALGLRFALCIVCESSSKPAPFIVSVYRTFSASTVSISQRGHLKIFSDTTPCDI